MAPINKKKLVVLINAHLWWFRVAICGKGTNKAAHANRAAALLKLRRKRLMLAKKNASQFKISAEKYKSLAKEGVSIVRVNPAKKKPDAAIQVVDLEKEPYSALKIITVNLEPLELEKENRTTEVVRIIPSKPDVENIPIEESFGCIADRYRAPSINKRSTFFDRLPEEKKLILLKRAKNLTTMSISMAQEIADELHLSVDQVRNWLKNRRNLNLQNRKLSPRVVKVLEGEYTMNDYLSEKRALLIAKHLNVAVELVQTWFRRRRAKDGIAEESTAANQKENSAPRILLPKPYISVLKVKENVSKDTSDVGTIVSADDSRNAVANPRRTPCKDRSAKIAEKDAAASRKTAKETVNKDLKKGTFTKVVVTTEKGCSTKASTSMEVEAPADESLPLPEEVMPLDKTNSAEAPDPSRKKKCRVKKTPAQLNLLFEELKANPKSISAERLAYLVTETGLDANQIKKWLQRYRERYQETNLSKVQLKLKKNLNAKQIKELEAVYKRSRFVDETELFALKTRLNLSITILQSWFISRLLYEMFTASETTSVISAIKKATIKEPAATAAVATTTVKQAKIQPIVMNVKNIADITITDAPDESSFFAALPTFKKVRLMKESKNPSSNYKTVARDLELPVQEVETWMASQNRDHRQNKSGFTEEQQRILEQKFEVCDRVTKEESATLATEWKIPLSKIQNWFVNRRRRRLKVEKENDISPASNKSPSSSKEQASKKRHRSSKGEASKKSETLKDIAQKRALFEECKKSLHLPLSKQKSIASRLHLSSKQVGNWFRNVRKMLRATKPKDLLNRIRNKSFTPSQLAVLEAEFLKTKFVSATRCEHLAKQLGISKLLVVRWFGDMRYYELHTGSIALSKVSSSTGTVFDKLSSSKKSRLTRELKSYPFSDDRLNSLAEELNVPKEKLKNWFENERRATTMVTVSRKLSASRRRMPFKSVSLLRAEFQRDPNMTDERAKQLSMKYKIAMDRIKLHFKKRQMRENTESETVKQKPTLSVDTAESPVPKAPVMTGPTVLEAPKPRESKDKVPSEHNHLFEEFKKSFRLTPERTTEISQRLGFSTQQVGAWFHWLHTRLSSIPETDLLESNRNKNLTPQQVLKLENIYQMDRYISMEERHALAEELGLSRSVIKLWFAHRRYSEILESPAGIALRNHDKEFAQEKEPADESVVVDYDWENEEEVKVNVDQISPLIAFVGTSNKTDVEYLNNPSPEIKVETQLEEDIFADLSEEESCNETAESAVKRASIAALNSNMDPIEYNVKELFWFVFQSPKQIFQYANNHLCDSANEELEACFAQNSKPTLSEMWVLSDRLQINISKIHWWFIKRRKKASIRSAHTIDLTEDEVMPVVSETVQLSEVKTSILVSDLEPISEDELIIDELVVQKKIATPTNEQEQEANDIDDDSFEMTIVDEWISSENFIVPLKQEVEDDDLSTQIQTHREDGAQLDSLMDQDVQVKQAIADDNISPPVNEDKCTVAQNNVTSANKAKKKKILISSHQRAILFQEFSKSEFISINKAKMLGKDLGLSVKTVQFWFKKTRNSMGKKGGSSDSGCKMTSAQRNGKRKMIGNNSSKEHME